jgi:flagellar basal body-associated protein FliL
MSSESEQKSQGSQIVPIILLILLGLLVAGAYFKLTGSLL